MSDRIGLFDDAGDLDEVLGQLAGYASLCWEPKPEGVFDSGTAASGVRAAAARLADLGIDRKIPRYAMLDVWMALYGADRSQEFEAFADEHGYAETWARLCATVRELRGADL